MVALGRGVPILLCVLISFRVNSGFLDLEELKSVHYGISLINDPVVMGKEPPGAILLRSKFGQPYQCSFPDRQSEDEKAKQEQQEAIDIGIPDLLKPMGQQACLIHPKDWWTYEFCYGKFVKQYHMESGKIVGNIIYLGYFESEFDWNNITEQDKKRKYHSQTYTNGTVCDLTNNQRRLEVRFECEEGSVDYVYEISEAETCVYTLKVHTPRVCKHPYLQKPAPAVPIPITCNPLVTPEQYQHHIETIQEKEKSMQDRNRLKEENLLENQGEEKQDYIKMYRVKDKDGLPSLNIEVDSDRDRSDNPATNSDSQTDGGLREVKEEPTVERLLRDTFGLKNNEDTGGKNTNHHPLVNDKKLKVKVFKDHSELRDYIKKMVAQGKAKTQTAEETEGDHKTEGDVEENGSSETIEEMDEGENGDDSQEDDEDQLAIEGEGDAGGEETATDEDDKLVEEFSKELSDIVDTEEKRVHIARYKETIKSAMQAKFSDILDEAGQELADDVDVKANKDVAIKAMATTLNKLIKKLTLTKLLKKVKKEKAFMEQQIQLAKQRMIEEKNQAGDTPITAEGDSSTDLEEDSETETAEDNENLPDADTESLEASHSEIRDTADNRVDPDSPQSQITDSQTTDDTEHMHLADNVQNIENTENIDSTHTQGIPEGKETRDDAYTTENMPAFDSTHSTENTLSTENTHSTENKQSTENAPTTDRKHSTEDPHTTVNTHSSENTEKDEVEEEEEEEMGSIENRVRVRVTRIKHAAPTDGGTSLTGEGTEDKKMLELPEEQRKQLETTVKSELEKAGLETQGQKIEVKIITAGYFDTNKEGVHVLSEEESSAFNNMIISILGGNNQAAQELTRQRQMEDSYSFVWGQNTKKVKSTHAPKESLSTQDTDTPNTAPEAPTEPQQPPE